MPGALCAIVEGTATFTDVPPPVRGLDVEGSTQPLGTFAHRR
jgi:hypothetical protein